MKRVYFWARLLLSSGLILFLFFTIDKQHFSTIVAGSNFSYGLLAFALGLGDRVLMAYKWNILLRAKAIWISLKDITFTYLTATFLGLFLPATVGGDALRAYAVARKGHLISDIVSSIIVERILGLLALITFVVGSIALSIFVFGQTFFTTIGDLFWTTVAAFVVLLLLLFMSLSESAWRWLSSLLRRWSRYRRGQKLVKVLQDVYQSYLSYRHAKPALIFFLLLSFVENLFPILWSYCLSLAFNIQVPLLYFFVLVPIVLILRRLPISIDGIGIHEGAFVYFLSLFGVVQTEALLLGVATHILAVLIVLPGGILYALTGLGGRNHAGEKVKGVFNSPMDIQADIPTPK
jgi:uncharacterized protein (TIRG00374 family)